MRPEEALAHRWLATDGTMVRRRENIKYGSHRLLRTAQRRLRQQCQFARNGSAGHSPIPPLNGSSNGHPDDGGKRNGNGQNGLGPKGGEAFGSDKQKEPSSRGAGPPRKMDTKVSAPMRSQQQQQRMKFVSAEC